MTLRDSHPVLAEVMGLLHGLDPVVLQDDFRARLERTLAIRPPDQRPAGIRNLVRLARYLEQDLGSPTAARQLLDALADLSFTDAELRTALKQAGERLAAAVDRITSSANAPATIRANQFAIPMRG